MVAKKKHAAINKKSNNSDNPNRPTEGKGGLRSKSTIMRLNMYKRGGAVRNKDGKIIGGSLLMNNKAGGKDLPNVARVAPDRRWFGNTRTISQHDLEKFREEMSVKETDPYSVILRRQRIPMALLKDSEKVAKMNLLETEKFDEVFGGKQKRKRPKLAGDVSDYTALAEVASAKAVTYDKDPSADSNIEVEATREVDARKDDLFSKGQSKRIWAELYKVLDCSDVILQIVDARNVPGTRCLHIEKHIKKNASHKHLVIVLNKCDLVPSWVTRKWVKILSADYPTLAYHASLTNAFGKGALISLLRQFGKLFADKRQISVGVIGYPNCGKSSVINSLMGKKCCKTAPVPGETKVWQYITLMKRIYLIDCPGVVYDTGDDEVETVLKGVVRAERLHSPTDFIAPILDRVKPEYLQRQYSVSGWAEGDAVDFLTKIAMRSGRLGKGGEPDLNTVAVQVINDWQRGKLPYFVPPPRDDDNVAGSRGDPGASNDDDDDDMILGNEHDHEDEEDETPITNSLLDMDDEADDDVENIGEVYQEHEDDSEEDDVSSSARSVAVPLKVRRAVAMDSNADVFPKRRASHAERRRMAKQAAGRGAKSAITSSCDSDGLDELTRTVTIAPTVSQAENDSDDEYEYDYGYVPGPSSLSAPIVAIPKKEKHLLDSSNRRSTSSSTTIVSKETTTTATTQASRSSGAKGKKNLKRLPTPDSWDDL